MSERDDVFGPARQPPGVDPDTVEAVGKVSEALEHVERARGHLYSFHQLMGHADLALGEACDALRDAGHGEVADSVSTAMLLVLETLGPTERAVFVLREVFDLSYDEIAEALDKTPAAVRQVAHRARSHVEARRPRVVTDRAEQDAVTRRFLQAVADGDLQGLMDVLAPDVVLLTDGGGVKKAALQPIRGVEKVLRFLSAVFPDDVEARAEPLVVNGQQGIRFFADGVLDTVATWRIDDGRVTGLYFVRNPHKLGRVGEEVPISRG